MRTMTIAVLASAVYLWGCQDKAAQTNTETNQMTMEKEHSMDHDNTMDGMSAVYYTCPMESHKHVHATEPGDCPECGMKLVAAVETTADEADYFGCPMPSHSHVRADSAGSCPECGMDLKPMKLSGSNS